MWFQRVLIDKWAEKCQVLENWLPPAPACCSPSFYKINKMLRKFNRIWPVISPASRANWLPTQSRWVRLWSQPVALWDLWVMRQPSQLAKEAGPSKTQMLLMPPLNLKLQRNNTIPKFSRILSKKSKSIWPILTLGNKSWSSAVRYSAQFARPRSHSDRYL